jgi:endonuclease YncB( thermonuclease family)
MTATTFGPYPAIVRDWHDGDTCGLDIDLGFDHTIVTKSFDDSRRLACRIYGINAPELATAAGKAALAYAQTLCPPGTLVTVTSHGWDKYGGRFDGEITLPDKRSYGQAMIDAGMAVKM